MELRILKYFLEIAKEGNITKAAESLHITQPTLSRQIQQMEDELGVDLFDRSSRKLTLTEDGILLRRRAEEILELVDKTETELTAEKDKINGSISIGCGEINMVNDMIKLCDEFRNKYPDVTFNFYTAHASEVLKRIDEGSLDMGLILMYNGRNDAKYNYAVFEKEENWSCVMRENSELAHKDIITPKDLINKPLVLSFQWAEGVNLINSWFNSSHSQIKPIYYSSMKTNTFAIIKNTGAYSIVTDEPDSITGYTGIVKKPIEPALHCQVAFAWKKNQPYSKAVTKFINFIKCSEGIEK